MGRRNLVVVEATRRFGHVVPLTTSQRPPRWFSSSAHGARMRREAGALDILLCDDHRLLAEAMEGLLRERGHRVVLASRPAEAADLAGQQNVDVCVMDLAFPDDAGDGEGLLDPIDAIGRIAAEGPKVVVFSASADTLLQARALEAGASDCVEKAEPVAALMDAIERAHGGSEVTSPRFRSSRRRRTSAAARLDGWTRASLADFLTPRERDVLEGLVRGESTTQLAQWLQVRPATARTHVQNLLAKLCVHSRLEAVALAVEYGLVDVAQIPR